MLVPDDIKGKADLGEQDRFLQADLSLPYFTNRGCSLGANNVLFCINLRGLDFEGKSHSCLGQGQEGVASCVVEKVRSGTAGRGR